MHNSAQKFPLKHTLGIGHWLYAVDWAGICDEALGVIGQSLLIGCHKKSIMNKSSSPSKFGFVFIIVELLVLFVILPLLYAFDLLPFHKIIPLIGLLAYCAVILAAKKQFSMRKFKIETNWKTILLRLVIFVILLFALLKLFSSYPLISDISENKKLLYMLFLYPLLSAFPQELIFREFFFYRYRNVLKNPQWLLVLNVLLFAFAHIYFGNWIVIGFTLVGGLIFALTFMKTRSITVVTIEHSLYGLIILSSGLSPHFYKAF